jgi:predicted nucleotidyltransferase
MATTVKISLPKDRLAEFCRRHGIRRLSLFGSVLRDDFCDESDVDILVEFHEGVQIGLIGLAGLELELTQMIGRRVDLNTKGFLSRYFRDAVLAEAEVMYDAA